jgi:hypothetical protein
VDHDTGSPRVHVLAASSGASLVGPATLPKSGAVLGLATFLPTLDQWGSIAVHVFSIERLVRSTPTERNFA